MDGTKAILMPGRYIPEKLRVEKGCMLQIDVTECKQIAKSIYETLAYELDYGVAKNVYVIKNTNKTETIDEDGEVSSETRINIKLYGVDEDNQRSKKFLLIGVTQTCKVNEKLKCHVDEKISFNLNIGDDYGMESDISKITAMNFDGIQSIEFKGVIEKASFRWMIRGSKQ